VTIAGARARRTPAPGGLAADAADLAPETLELVSLANELVVRIWGHMMARAAELNLSMAEAKALQNLEADQAMPMRALAARVHANPSNVTVIVARLEVRGLVSRDVGSDRRVKGARLTAAGLKLRRQLELRLLTDHPAVYGLSAAERHNLLLLLQRVHQTA
jgi:MarR family transcriptional regulator, organic hydroperoxide resistance regulator